MNNVTAACDTASALSSTSPHLHGGGFSHLNDRVGRYVGVVRGRGSHRENWNWSLLHHSELNRHRKNSHNDWKLILCIGASSQCALSFSPSADTVSGQICRPSKYSGDNPLTQPETSAVRYLGADDVSVQMTFSKHNFYGRTLVGWCKKGAPYPSTRLPSTFVGFRATPSAQIKFVQTKEGTQSSAHRN